MRSFVAYILLFSPLVSFTQGTWERINVPTNQFLKSVCFVDSVYGWVAGDSGVLLHTMNGGVTWTQQDTHSTNEVEDVFFLNRNLGWASTFNFTSVPYGTILLKTTNGGANWVSQTYPVENIFITCILFRDSLHGWMGGRPHALVRTNDGGNSWVQAPIDTSTLAFFPVLSIKFYNDQYGYASGGMFDIAGVTWHTSNGGDMWYAIDPSQAPADEVHGLHLFDSLNVMGAGGDPDFGYGVGMIRTADGGQNWVYDELVIQGNAYDLDFRNDQEAWAPLGPRQKMIYSLDAGVTWNEIPSPGFASMYDITFPDSLHGYAVGKEGTVLKYHPPVMPSVPITGETKSQLTLHQNNPNPVQSGTNIRYTISGPGQGQETGQRKPAGNLWLKVYNIYGIEAASILIQNTSPGDHDMVFDASNLPGGIYLYCLQSDGPYSNHTVANPKRMVVLD